MAVQTVLTITHGLETIATIESKLQKQATKPHEAAISVSGFFNALNGGDRRGSWTSTVNSGDAVAAHGTITLSSFVATNTFTIGNQVFTCESSGATGQNQFNVGGSDTLSAAAAVVVINSNTKLNSWLLATNALGVITVTCLNAGVFGNSVPIAISAHGSVSGSGFLTSGADPATTSAAVTYHLGV